MNQHGSLQQWNAQPNLPYGYRLNVVEEASNQGLQFPIFLAAVSTNGSCAVFSYASLSQGEDPIETPVCIAISGALSSGFPFRVYVAGKNNAQNPLIFEKLINDVALCQK